jgi:tetratricopeptide (TPR) repeat protein
MAKRSFLVIVLVVLFLVCFSIPAFSQFNSLLSLRVTPGINIPLGEDALLFSLGPTGMISGEIAMPFFPILFASVDVGYSFEPIKSEANNLSAILFGAGVGLDFNPIPLLSIRVFGKGGAFGGFLHQPIADAASSGWRAFVEGGLGAWVLFHPRVGAGIDAGYRGLLGLTNELFITAGVVVNVVPSKKGMESGGVLEHKPGQGLDLLDVSLDSVFPVFYGYYDDNPVGTAVIKNFEKRPIEDIEMTFYVKQYMDNPKKCTVPVSLAPGEEAEVDLYGLFTNSILSVSEGTKVSALVTTKYSFKGGNYKRETVETLEVQNRNAVTWDDDRRVAAFVTAKDSAVLKFAKNTASIVQANSSPAVNKNLALAMGIHTALREHGMSYVIDPSTPYAELAGSTEVVDFVQFPMQSLEYKAGDCDDLSILYAALLESVGIETAFITIPGHIYMAFSTGLSEADAENQFARPEDLVYMDGAAWVPVEITEIGGGFLKAWQTGAKEWRENVTKLKAQFYSTHEAWTHYSAVGFDIAEADVKMPAEDRVTESFVREYSSFVQREIGPRVDELQAEINRSQSLKAVNKLGVLYARYGLYEQAETEFKQVVEQQEYLPALVNLGNINFLSEDYPEALEFYERAESVRPDNPTVLLGVARASHQLEDYPKASASYAQLKTVDPGLAERFSYLGASGESASRAADQAQVKELMVWEEE